MNHPILLPHDNAKHAGDVWIDYMTDHITTIGEIQRGDGLEANGDGELQRNFAVA